MFPCGPQTKPGRVHSMYMRIIECFLVRKTHPTIELDVLKDRAMKSGFDFIDFRAVDFDWHNGKPFEHNWQDFRTRKDRTLKTVSDFGYDRYPKKGRYTACVKVIDVFGCDTSITVEVNI